jgi:histidine triad (HIT) family protein
MVTQEELEKMSPEEISALQKQNCIFCKIISGEIPSKKIFEDDKIVAILDIRPATKGHILILPKEHYPILPLVPPDVFKRLFVQTKFLSNVLKKALLCSSVSLFIANGAVAGQQSPHFLFHLIPREKNDGLTFLDLPVNSEFVSFQKDIASSLKNNLEIMMKNHVKREGKTLIPEVKLSEEERREKVFAIIEENKDARALLRKSPAEFRKLISENDDLKNIFLGVDLEKLSEKLNEMPEEEIQKPKPEVFLGSDPLEQKNRVFKYFDEKPKAKELLMDDVVRFKELLSSRPDIQEIFKDVNIDKLSEKLNEVKK